MPYVVTDSVRLYYEVTGNGHPVIFLHGHAMDHRAWKYQLDEISRNYTIVTPDIRGHGKSDAPKTGYSFDDYAKDVRDLAVHLGLTRPSLVGHSLGGNIAIQYALTYPKAITTLTLVDSGLEGVERTPEVQAEFDRRNAFIRAEGVSEKFVRAALMGPSFEGLRDKPEARALAKEMLSAWSGATATDEAVYAKPAKAQGERLDELRLPVHVILGERDIPRFHRISEVLVKKILVVRKTTLANVGHFPQLEDPDAFNDAVIDFLGGSVGKAML